MRRIDFFGCAPWRSAVVCFAICVMPQLAMGDIVTWQGGTGGFGDTNWTVDGVMGQSHPGFSTGDHDTTISSGTVNFTTNTGTEDGFYLRDNDSATLDGGSINGNFLALNAGGTVFTLDNGTITLSDSNALRSISSIFNMQLDWTGAAGAGSLVQTNNSVNATSLAGKISLSNPLFAIDGTGVSSSVLYNGANLAAVNADLATQVVNGRFFQISEAGGSQTLSLSSSVPEPSSIGILALAGIGFLSRRRKLS